MKLKLLLTALAACTIYNTHAAADTKYAEPLDTITPADETLWYSSQYRKSAELTWASKDSVYRSTAPVAQDIIRDLTVKAWRGERVGAEALVIAPKAVGEVKVELTGLRKGGKTFNLPDTYAAWMRYVIGNDCRKCWCDDPDKNVSSFPDMIDNAGSVINIPARTVRPVWCSVEIPREFDPGIYTADLLLKDAKTGKTLKSIILNIDVCDRTLPRPEDYAFYLDLWQQPYAISRYYVVKPWSDEHLKLYEPYARMLARAGQKVTSVILFYEPWGEQSNDKFQPMVETVRHADGTYSYDYTILDRYVEFMDKNGITGDIECFTMIPWQMEFRYLDEPTGEYKTLKTTTDAPEYAQLWTPFLQSLAKHFKEKGWYDRLMIGMDERGVEDMLRAYKVAQDAVPGIRMSLAGNYHKELVDKLDVYTILKEDFFPASDLAMRAGNGYKSLVYTCCVPPVPNQFINAQPSYGAYIPAYATAAGFDGYLHWSYSNWNNTPMTDSRFQRLPPGDTFFVYPDGRSSIRYERMLEGIQLSEKIRLLRKEFADKKDVDGLLALEAALLPIRTGVMRPYYPTSTVVNDLERNIDSLSRR